MRLCWTFHRASCDVEGLSSRSSRCSLLCNDCCECKTMQAVLNNSRSCERWTQVNATNSRLLLAVETFTSFNSCTDSAPSFARYQRAPTISAADHCTVWTYILGLQTCNGLAQLFRRSASKPSVHVSWFCSSLNVSEHVLCTLSKSSVLQI